MWLRLLHCVVVKYTMLSHKLMIQVRIRLLGLILIKKPRFQHRTVGCTIESHNRLENCSDYRRTSQKSHCYQILRLQQAKTGRIVLNRELCGRNCSEKIIINGDHFNTWWTFIVILNSAPVQALWGQCYDLELRKLVRLRMSNAVRE